MAIGGVIVMGVGIAIFVARHASPTVANDSKKRMSTLIKLARLSPIDDTEP